MKMNKRLLNKDQIQNIFQHCGIDEEIIKSWYKDFLSMYPHGKMDKKQFYKFYKLMSCSTDKKTLNRHIIDHIFSCFDSDKSGFLDFSEFLIAYSGTSNKDPIVKLEFIFTFYVSNMKKNVKSLFNKTIFG